MTVKNVGQSGASKTGPHAFMHVRAQHPWFVVADSRVAKVLIQHDENFDLIYKIEQPVLNIDGLDNKGRGRGRVSPGTGQHAYEPRMNESRQEELALAREIALWLEKEFDHAQFKSLVIVAAPRMLGEIRKNLGKMLTEAVIMTSGKELANHTDADLARELFIIMKEADGE